MPRFACTLGLLICSCTLLTSPQDVRGENWPGWRGPTGDGQSAAKNAPLAWDGATGKNIVWRVEIPGEGHASPIVWEEHVFLISCISQSKQRVLLALDRRSGKQRWQKTLFQGPLESKHALNSFASSTPATDGETVFATFLEVDGHTVPAPNVGRKRPITPGRMVVAAYDFDGNRKWMVKPGEFISAHGFCSSPLIYQNLLIVNGDHDGNSYLIALDKRTGKTVWKTPRRHKTRSYATPIIREIGGRTQMVLSGSMCISSFNPLDGSRHWSIEGPTEQFVASMVYDGKLFFMAAGFPTYHVMGIKPDGKGDVSESHVAWHQTNIRCYVPSPVVVGNYLLVADDRGTANCFDAASGKRLWQHRLGKHFSASLVSAGGLVYFLADDGRTTIVKPGPTLEVVAEHALGENCYASPAIAQGQLFVRAEKHLYCIGNQADGK